MFPFCCFLFIKYLERSKIQTVKLSPIFLLNFHRFSLPTIATEAIFQYYFALVWCAESSDLIYFAIPVGPSYFNTPNGFMGDCNLPLVIHLLLEATTIGAHTSLHFCCSFSVIFCPILYEHWLVVVVICYLLSGKCGHSYIKFKNIASTFRE